MLTEPEVNNRFSIITQVIIGEKKETYSSKFSMCLYERVGWLGSRELGFSNRDLGKRAGNFAI